MAIVKCPYCFFEKDVDENLIPSGKVIVKCPKCEKTFDYQKGDFVFSESVSENNQSVADKGFKYAGFWIRLFAYIIDSLLLLILFAIPVIFFKNRFAPEKVIERIEIGDMSMLLNVSFFLVTILIVIIFSIGYYIVSWSKWGKTLGMKILGIKVVDRDGKNISMGKAFLRWLMGYFLPGIIPYIGILFYIALGIMIGIDDKKQGWHDKVAGSFVVYE